MADPFISEMRMFGFNYPPRGWATCNGQTLPINQNQTLYSLLGTNFGGNGRTSFNLPDMRGRVPVSNGVNQGIQFNIGNFGGEEYVTLTETQMGVHTHAVRGTTAQGNVKPFEGAIFAEGYDKQNGSASPIYGEPANLTSLKAESVSANGGGAAHGNVQPSLVVNYCIALTGEFPSRN